MSIIKGLAALLAPRWDPATWSNSPLDLTRPGSGVTREERRALWAATGTIAGTVVSLETYRERRQYLGRKPRPAIGSSGCMDPRD
ncbi:MAG: hypothetical protein ACYC5Y_04965 [Symbiobacteriia bacterium]